MIIGYIRVSRDKQTTALQVDALAKAQCERTFTDKMSGKRFDRPEFLKMVEMLRSGDVLVVWRLDRLGRSLKELIETVNRLAERGVELRSIKEQIDTTTPTGRLMFHVIAALAFRSTTRVKKVVIDAFASQCKANRCTFDWNGFTGSFNTRAFFWQGARHLVRGCADAGAHSNWAQKPADWK